MQCLQQIKMIKKIYNRVKKKILWFFIGGVAIASVGDVAIQTKAEVLDIIATQQEICLQDTGNYCQFLRGRERPTNQPKSWENAFGSRIRVHDYEIVINVWGGGKGDLKNQRGYSVIFIDPPVPFVNSTSTTP